MQDAYQTAFAPPRRHSTAQQAPAFEQRLRRALLLTIAAAMLAAVEQDALAQSTGSLHWAYAPFFGTGTYRLEAGLDTYVLAVEFRKRIHPRQPTEARRAVRVAIRVPVALGAYELQVHDLLDNVRSSNVSTISAVPGIEITVPMTERWDLKPLLHAGWGTFLDQSGSAAIYWGGVKSRLQLGPPEAGVSLINSLIQVGYSPRSGPSGKALPLMTGVEFERPLPRRKLGGETVHLYWHVAHTRYLDELTFRSAGDTENLDIAGEWEIGIAFGKSPSRLRLWRLSWDRLGIAYRVSGDGEFHGLSLIFGSLFDR